MSTETAIQTFDFTITLAHVMEDPDEQLDELCGKVLATGCDDATVSCRANTVYLSFDRQADDLSSAVGSAIKAIQKAGYAVAKIEIEPS